MTTDRRSQRLGYLLGALGVVIFGLTYPATRLAVTELDPYFVAFGRATLAGLAAGLTLAAVRSPLPAREHWPRLVRYGLLVIVAFPVLMTVALKEATAAHAGVIAAVMPLATAVAGYFVAGERPSRGFWACALAGSAVVLIYTWAYGASLGVGVRLVDLMLLAAVISASWGYAEGGVLARVLGGWQTISWTLVLALPAMALMTVVAGGPIAWQAGWKSWAGFLYVGLFSMFLGFFAWNRGLALGGIAKVGQVQLVQPFVTLAGAALLLGERIGWLELVFAVMVVTLVAIGSRMRVDR